MLSSAGAPAGFSSKLQFSRYILSVHTLAGPTGRRLHCFTNSWSAYRPRSAHESDTPPQLRKRRDQKQDSPFWTRLPRTLCRTINRTGLFALTSSSVPSFGFLPPSDVEIAPLCPSSIQRRLSGHASPPE